MANRQRDPSKEAYWRKVLRRHAASGLSVRAFCRREALSEASLYAWRRTLRQRDSQLKPPLISRQTKPPVTSRQVKWDRSNYWMS